MAGQLAKFREEFSWPKIVGETLIIVVGVFLGIQASNWNDARKNVAETANVLQRLRPELQNNLTLYRTIDAYYAVSRRYADVAFAGWRGDPKVSDRDFVIAAYQASQNYFIANVSGSWSQIFGADRLRDIDNDRLRTDLGYLMTTDYSTIERDIFTEYRRNVRMVIPEDIQDAIRKQCGDQRIPGTVGFLKLPATCSIDLPDAKFVEAARALRAHPELVGQLRWHIAAVATYLGNVSNFRATSERILQSLDKAAK